MKVKEVIYDAETGHQQLVEREQTAAELAEIAREQKIARIQELKQTLKETDYQAIKFAEGALTEEEYAEIRVQRQSWRDEINRLEKLV